MVDLAGTASSIGSKIGGVVTSGFHFVTYAIIFIIFAGIVGVGIYFIMMQMKFKNKIVLFELINGKPEVIGKDRAIEIKIGGGGDTIFYLQKRKKYLPKPELQTGRRTYWYWIRQDGEWINFTMDNLDERQKKLGAKFLHSEMRYARVGIQKNLKERYDKPKFLEKYGAMLINLGAIVIILIFLWLIVDKIIGVGSQVNSMAETGKQVMDKAQQVLSGLDNICSNSGAKVVGG